MKGYLYNISFYGSSKIEQIYANSLTEARIEARERYGKYVKTVKRVKTNDFYSELLNHYIY